MNDNSKQQTPKFDPVRSDFLVFGAPQIEQAEIDEVLATMRSGWLGTGPKVTQFEGDFARYEEVDSSLVAALSSCTAALHLSLRVVNLAPGDEVITTALTFCATVNAIIHAGATPVLADVDAHTMNIDPNAITARITPKTRVILPVHFAGRACNMDAIMDIAARHNLLVIEDCAHAIETEFKGHKAGTVGDFGCFSFYVTKNVVTGEGGMVIAHDPEHIKRIKSLALHGLSQDAWKRFSDVGYKHYQVEDCGFKYNMMDLQAAIGIHQLARVDKNWNRRKAIWDHYQQAFSKLPVTRPPAPSPDMRHAYHLYTLLINEAAMGISRDTFLDAMTQQNIGVGVHYLSIPEHPYYRRTFGWRAKDYPNATRIGQQTVSLPLSAKLTDTDVEDVIHAVQKICS